MKFRTITLPGPADLSRRADQSLHCFPIQISEVQTVKSCIKANCIKQILRVLYEILI